MREKMIEMERQMGEFAQSGATGIVAGGGFRTRRRKPPRHAIVRAAPRIVR